MSQWWSQSLSTTCQAPEHHLEKLNLSLSAVPLPEPYQGKKAGYAPAVDTVWYLHWSGSSVSLEEIPSKWQYITITHSAPAGRSSTRTPESPKPRKAASVAGCLLTRCVLVSALAQCVPCLTTPSSDCSLSCPWPKDSPTGTFKRVACWAVLWSITQTTNSLASAQGNMAWHPPAWWGQWNHIFNCLNAYSITRRVWWWT